MSMAEDTFPIVNASARQIFEVLRLIGGSQEPLSSREVSERLNMQISKAHRALRTLQVAGYITRYHDSSSYVAGDALRQLRRAFFSRFTISQACLAQMQLLAFVTGETIALRAPIGFYSVLVASVSGTKEIVQSRALGQYLPLHQGAGSNAILAFLPKEFLERLINWREAQGEKISRKTINQELKLVRERGYAIQKIAFAQDFASVAIPLRIQGTAIASIGIEGGVVDLREPESPMLDRCKDIIGQIEYYLSKHADKIVNPYSHIDPAEIVLTEPAAL